MDNLIGKKFKTPEEARKHLREFLVYAEASRDTLKLGQKGYLKLKRKSLKNKRKAWNLIEKAYPELEGYILSICDHLEEHFVVVGLHEWKKTINEYRNSQITGDDSGTTAV